MLRREKKRKGRVLSRKGIERRKKCAEQEMGNGGSVSRSEYVNRMKKWLFTHDKKRKRRIKNREAE